MSREVSPRLRDLVDCPCGCGAYGRIVARTGHARGCGDDCPRCARRSSMPTNRRGEIPEQVRRQVAVRSGGACEANVEGVCTGRGEHAHHVLPRSAGGTHHPANLLWTCAADHRWIHEHPENAYELGLLTRRGES